MRIKYYNSSSSSSFLYLSSLLLVVVIVIDRPWLCKSESFFGKIARFATGGGGGGSSDSNNSKNNNSNSNSNVFQNRNTNNKDGSQQHVQDKYDFPTTKLSNGIHFPLVGLGVGNMEPDVVSAIISHGLKDDKNIRLIDTAHVSRNEFLVAKGIVEGVDRLLGVSGTGTGDAAAAAAAAASDVIVEVHVITKIWYTHLGYNRTLLSAKSSLESLKEAIDHPNIDLKVHLLLHWPRCYDEIPWMDCLGEEENLPQEVKAAGPPPHLNKETAWKESWKALEELYVDENTAIASIGVSNFHRTELEELVSSSVANATIVNNGPHIVQTDTWSLLYDPLLIEFCHKRGIHLVAHHLMEGVVNEASNAPFASHHLLSIANELTKDMRVRGNGKGSNFNNNNKEITAAQVVLTWLVQHSISVIPRTTDLYHLQENSATSLSEIPPLDDHQVQIVAQSVEAILSGEDLTEDAFVTLTFHANTKDVYLYWHDPEFGGEIEVAKIEKGNSFEESSHPGHQFRIYDAYAAAGDNDDADDIGDTIGKGSNMELFTVSGNYGEHRHIEL